MESDAIDNDAWRFSLSFALEAATVVFKMSFHPTSAALKLSYFKQRLNLKLFLFAGFAPVHPNAVLGGDVHLSNISVIRLFCGCF